MPIDKLTEESRREQNCYLAQARLELKVSEFEKKSPLALFSSVMFKTPLIEQYPKQK